MSLYSVQCALSWWWKGFPTRATFKILNLFFLHPLKVTLLTWKIQNITFFGKVLSLKPVNIFLMWDICIFAVPKTMKMKAIRAEMVFMKCFGTDINIPFKFLVAHVQLVATVYCHFDFDRLDWLQCIANQILIFCFFFTQTNHPRLRKIQIQSWSI